MILKNTGHLIIAACSALLLLLVSSSPASAQTTVQVASGTFSSSTAFSSTAQPCGSLTSPVDCRFSEFPGAFFLPNGQLILAFNLSTGPTSPDRGRTFMSEVDLNKFKRSDDGRMFTHTFPAPSGYWYYDRGRDLFGLSGNCPASPTLPTTQKCSAVVYRLFNGSSWSTWRTDAYQSLGPHSYSAQPSLMLPNGTLVRRVNGDDLQNLPSTVPKTAMIQVLKQNTDGTYPSNWPALGGAGQVVSTAADPSICKYQVSRIKPVSGGRYIALGQQWQYASGTSGPCTSTPSSNLLLVAGSDIAVEQGDWKVGMPYVAAGTLAPNEWDAAELDNGDLLAMFRTTVAGSQVRRQARLVKKTGVNCPAPTDGNIGCWVLDTATLGNPNNFAHSGHPELLSTVQNGVRVVIYFSDSAGGGVFYTINDGASWATLNNAGSPFNTRYYPRAVQDASGNVYVFSWVGGDNPYGGLAPEEGGGNFSGVNQTIFMQKFQIAVINPPTVPTVTTGAAGNITSTTATLNGTVNPNGQAATYNFQYGPTTSYGSNTATQNLAAGSTAVPVSAGISGLTPGQTYHFRLVATNASGTTNGADQTFTTSSGGTTYAQTVLNSNPVSYWRLGEAAGVATAADQKGVNAGTYVNGVIRGVAGAVPGNTAASFDGVDDQVNIPDSASLDTGDVFTAEAWVKVSQLGVSNTIVNKFGSWFLYLDATNKLRLYKPNSGTVVVSSAAISDTTNFHHVAVTKNGATVRLYLDGVDVTGTVTNLTLANGTGALFIGYLGGSPFHGVIDEVAIYNTALSAATIANHYSARNN